MKPSGRGFPKTVCALALFATFIVAGKAQTCEPKAAGISLPPGFCATIFADNLGHARHLAVAPNGIVFVNTWSGSYYSNKELPAGGFLVALQDTNGDGHANIVRRFGPSSKEGSAGGTGITVYKGGLFVEVNDRIVRYGLPAKGIVPDSPPAVIVEGLPLDGDHPMHPFTIDSNGNLFVNSGSASNACQQANRMLRSPGHQPCDELKTRGGIWRYDANKTGQKFSPAERYATGIRNSEGMAFDSHGRFFVTQHGRDQLFQNWPALYNAYEGAELPAEVVVQLEQGADYGWPTCYFDGFKKQNILAPEFGGDGKKEGGCSQKRKPAAFFPAHWAPNAMVIYSGRLFPATYKDGLFIAFHGSWNRAPAPQGGYNVVFQPMKDGMASGAFSIFADGFAGATKEPGKAAFRPAGIAMGPDGSLYIADDVHGRIWRVTYQGDTSKTQASSQAVQPTAVVQKTRTLPIPPGSTKEQVERGSKIYQNGSCAGCHASDANGSALGSDLTSGKWLWGDGSVQSIAQIIKTGVPHPKEHIGAMPAMGGATFSQAELDALAVYVWALGH
jgi:glucose/arabinose dehydrogenase/cytochrome c5